MNTSSPLKALTSPPFISTSRPTAKAFPNPRFSSKNPRFSPKTIRCMRDSETNLNFGSNPNPPNRDFPLSFATLSVEAPPGTITTTTTSDKLRHLVSEFRSLTEPIDRVKRLLNYASALAPLDDSARVSANRVTGCATQVWLDIKMDEFGRMRFRADSDSEISKGFCSCLIWILDGAKPEEVMGVRSEDLTEMNVGVHGKAQSRVNTWHNVLMSMQKRTMALVSADVEHRGIERPPHDHLLFKYVSGSYMESSKNYVHPCSFIWSIKEGIVCCFIIGKTNTVEIHVTQPKKDDRELAEMDTKYFSRDFLQIAGMFTRVTCYGLNALTRLI